MKHIFLLNNHAGQVAKLTDLRNELSSYEKEEKGRFEYYVFNVRSAGKEAEEVKRIIRYFSGTDRLRLYLCGGSGTLCNAINGIEDLKEIETAFYPCGLTNDFLKVFGADQKYFHDIKSLIHGKPVFIDYIETNRGRLLNALSNGFDSKIIRKMEDYRAFSMFAPSLPYLMGGVNGVFLTGYESYRIVLDEKKEIVGNISEIFFGNGAVLGGRAIMTDNTDIDDGKAAVTLILDRQYLRIAPVALAAVKGDHKRIKELCYTDLASKITIERTDRKPFEINFDGELQEPIEKWEARIVNKGLKFVLPEGAYRD